MKTLPLKQNNNSLKKTLGLLSIMMLFLVASKPVYAQTTQANSSKEIIVKGTISDDQGPLEEASITLKGSEIGTASDKDGKFTFPKALKLGDILVFSHLGYDTTEITITENTTFIKLVMSSNVIEVVGAPNVEKRYKSKRSK